MTRIISIHEYQLKAGADLAAFEAAVQAAAGRGLFALPGLERYHLLHGIKGARRGAYAAVWIYASREAWEALWGSPEQPFSREQYPPQWRVWEDQVLAPFLDGEPDQVVYTAYEELMVTE